MGREGGGGWWLSSASSSSSSESLGGVARSWRLRLLLAFSALNFTFFPLSSFEEDDARGDEEAEEDDAVQLSCLLLVGVGCRLRGSSTPPISSSAAPSPSSLLSDAVHDPSRCCRGGEEGPAWAWAFRGRLLLPDDRDEDGEAERDEAAPEDEAEDEAGR